MRHDSGSAVEHDEPDATVDPGRTVKIQVGLGYRLEFGARYLSAFSSSIIPKNNNIGAVVGDARIDMGSIRHRPFLPDLLSTIRHRNDRQRDSLPRPRHHLAKLIVPAMCKAYREGRLVAPEQSPDLRQHPSAKALIITRTIQVQECNTIILKRYNNNSSLYILYMTQFL